MSMRGLIGLAVLLTLVACGTETSDPEPRAEPTPTVATPRVMPTATPVPSGPVTTSYPVTVLDDGDGAELCLGGTLDSLPPQCGGPRLIGWDWSAHEGDFDDRMGTRWGEFVVTGTFDGTAFTATQVVPADEFEATPYDDPYDFTTPCPEPEGGWRVIDPAKASRESQDATMRAARKLEDFAGSWVDQSINPVIDDPYSEEWEAAVNDPTKLILNIQVTGDIAAAEAALRELWGGALCVSQAQNTERELLRIQREILDLPGSMGGGITANKVDASLIYDDGSIQAWVDHEYGAGVVALTSLLTPVE